MRFAFDESGTFAFPGSGFDFGSIGAVAWPDSALSHHYPARLFLDNQVAGTGNSARSRRLGLRMYHLNSIPTPMLVFQTDESDGDVMCSARRLVRMSRITAASYVDASTRTSHLDPLVDLPSDNLLLKPLVRFLTPSR